jgi:hypothetical protein
MVVDGIIIIGLKCPEEEGYIFETIDKENELVFQ